LISLLSTTTNYLN